MKRTVNLLREFSIPLVAGVIVALFWANLDPEGYHHFIHGEFVKGLSFHFFINDIFMVFFFAIAAVEITQSLLPGGDLNPIKKAVNPLFSTLGGVLGPISVFFLLNYFMGEPTYARGWGIPTATDIALAWLVAKFVFGERHSAVSFLLLLAIADDAIGLFIIAIFYPDPLQPVAPEWLLLTLAGMLIAYILRRKQVKSYWPYLVIGGTLSWLGLHNAHLHPSLALVAIIPLLPNSTKESKHLFEDDGSDYSTLTQFEHEWKIFVDFGLFLFGIANAGVEFGEISNLTWIIFLSLLFGKSIGIFTFGSIAEKLGFPLPEGMGRKDLFVAGVVAGLGLTVALFVAGAAFIDTDTQSAAKMGALFSAGIVVIALVLGKLVGIKKVN